MKIIEDGLVWEVLDDPGGGVVDPFFGFDTQYIETLEAAYGQYCLSLKAQEGICMASHTDVDCMYPDDLVERASGTWGKRPRRAQFGKEIRTNTRYRRIIGTEHSHASRDFRKKAAVFQGKLKRMVHSYQKGHTPIARLRNKSAQAFQEIYTEAWNLGRKASGIMRLQTKVRAPSKAEEEQFRSTVREELSFWQGFLSELEGEVWQGRFSVDERVEMYSKTVWFIFHIGRISGMSDTVLLHWFPTRKRSGRMCPGCAYMVTNSPYPRDVMPTVPRGGDTPCLMRCVHKLIVRHVQPREVENRRKELPSREKMVRDLRGFMGSKIKKYRGRGKEFNPWLGSSIWGNLK